MMKRRNASSLYLINFCLFLALAVALIVAIYRYNSNIETITMSDNRYLTTEWHLLQELKARTDRELREKDIEIARLRSEYERLSEGDISAETLRELENELARAEKERDAILSQRLLSPSSESAGSRGDAAAPANTGSRAPVASPIVPVAGTSGESSSGPDGEAFVGDAATALSRLLGERITALEAKSAAYRLRAEAAEKSLAQAESRLASQSVPAAAEPDPGLIAEIEADPESGDLDRLRTLIEERKDGLNAEASPSLEDLKTRSLLRAIASTPAIKADYPGLLESMDRYFKAFGRQEWAAGQKDAYAFMLEYLDTLRAE